MCVMGVDLLNFVGMLLFGDKVLVLVGNCVLFCDGVFVVLLVLGMFYYVVDLLFVVCEDVWLWFVCFC